MPKTPVLVWFQRDLRLRDHPALSAALQTGAPVLPVFILDNGPDMGASRIGRASRVWLHHSLKALNSALKDQLVFRVGNPTEILSDLIDQTGARAVYWNRTYEPAQINRQNIVESRLNQMGVAAHSFNAALLHEPWEVMKPDGTPYRVFTPFYRKGCLGKGPPPAPLPALLGDIPFFPYGQRGSVEDLNLLPTSPTPRWDISMIASWTPGEAGAQARWSTFMEKGLRGYAQGRDYPDKANVSRLSPHLHWGEISPRQIWHDVQFACTTQSGLEDDADRFLCELGWRAFSHHLLYTNPSLPDTPLQPKFAHFPWRQDDDALARWQRGQTGFPIVDAGMRELWATGYMHNRVRMIVGSFLVKNLLLPWQAGLDWFSDTLVDADLANNAASWQWIAGCGADAAPYFRIFNPVLQGEKFDPDGTYVRCYVPELAALPASLIHRPWDAPPLILDEAGVKLGKTYPAPIIDHKKARDRALAALATLKDRD